MGVIKEGAGLSIPSCVLESGVVQTSPQLGLLSDTANSRVNLESVCVLVALGEFLLANRSNMILINSDERLWEAITA